MHRFAPVLAWVGLGLSLLHQSSLGATYGVVAGRAVLFRSTMPLLFIVSAVACGMSFTVLMTMVVQWLKRRMLVPKHVLFEAGQIAGGILLVYLYMRFWDSTVSSYGYVPGVSEAQQTLTSGSRFAIPFWAWEIGFGGLVAAILLIWARRRESFTMLAAGGGLAMVGLIANRWNTTMLAFTEPLTTEPVLTIPASVEYFPNAIEWMVSLGVVAGLALVFSLGIRYLPAYRGVSPAEAATPAGGDD
ncbi:MAG: polysulfide reductase NrfD [Anaerolineae bacterium]|nr:polysulfide reductase NrfD [Anaerolineae bacterium]